MFHSGRIWRGTYRIIVQLLVIVFPSEWMKIKVYSLRSIKDSSLKQNLK